MIRLLALFLTTAAPAFALSTERIVYTSDDGAAFHWGTTAEGILFVAPDADPADLYLLTPDCVVQNASQGVGSWGYEVEGWQISFGNRFILYFPGQTPPIDPSDCQMLR